jgi:hypothetical protein
MNQAELLSFLNTQPLPSQEEAARICEYREFENGSTVDVRVKLNHLYGWVVYTRHKGFVHPLAKSMAYAGISFVEASLYRVPSPQKEELDSLFQAIRPSLVALSMSEIEESTWVHRLENRIGILKRDIQDVLETIEEELGYLKEEPNVQKYQRELDTIRRAAECLSLGKE